jgi:hypothetical protein
MYHSLYFSRIAMAVLAVPFVIGAKIDATSSALRKSKSLAAILLNPVGSREFSLNVLL